MLLSKMMRGNGRGFSAVLMAGCAAALALTASSARGALTLTLSEPGYAPVTGTVSGSTDAYVGSYGDFTTDVVVGYSNSTTPGSLGELQVQSLNIVDSAAGSGVSKALTITFTDNDFTFPGLVGSKELLTSSLGGTLIAGTAGDKITFQSTATPSSGTAANPGVQTYTDPISNAGSQSFNIPAATATFTSTGLYTLSSQLVATFSTSGENANLSGTATVATVVPEPVSLSMMGIAATALLARRRRMF